MFLGMHQSPSNHGDIWGWCLQTCRLHEHNIPLTKELVFTHDSTTWFGNLVSHHDDISDWHPVVHWWKISQLGLATDLNEDQCAYSWSSPQLSQYPTLDVYHRDLKHLEAFLWPRIFWIYHGRPMKLRSFIYILAYLSPQRKPLRINHAALISTRNQDALLMH